MVSIGCTISEGHVSSDAKAELEVTWPQTSERRFHMDCTKMSIPLSALS